MQQIDDLEGVVLQNRCVIPGHYLLALKLERMIATPKPGQFVMLRVPGSDVFLRRPFSIYQYDRGVLSVLYRVAGKGTSALSSAGRGEKVMVLGPLGNGFTPLRGHVPVIIAGGIGVAGIHLLWERVHKKGMLFWGCASSSDMGLLGRIMRHAPQVATMDGSFGCTGNVVDLLAQHIGDIDKPGQIFACGPEAMYRSLAALLRDKDIPCQVLLEERMACGLGLCFGCVRKTLDAQEPYKRVCKEGPVFDLWQISL
jgi:dihydroorotate dehydrogenase electron transfer subunit